MSYLLLTLLLLPLVGSGLVFAWRNTSSKYLALGIALIQMLLTFYVVSDFDFNPTVDSVLQYEINYPWSQFIKSNLHFGIDGMSLLLLLLTNILMPIIILSSFNENVSYKNSFYGLILLMQFGLVGVFTALDGLLFYIFWEVTLIPIWFIAALWGQENKRLEFTTKFFVYTFVGSLFMLAGLIYVYTHSASFALTDLYNADLGETQQIVVFWFIFFAFAVKLPVFPFHTWQPDTYTYSPTQGSMLLSGIMLKMAIYGVLRYLLPITPTAIFGISGQIVIILAIVGIVHGALIAIIQTDMKRIIAYSSFSHVGLMVAGIFSSAVLTLRGTFTIEGAEGALVQTFAHGINVAGLFFCAETFNAITVARSITNNLFIYKLMILPRISAASTFLYLFEIVVFTSQLSLVVTSSISSVTSVACFCFVAVVVNLKFCLAGNIFTPTFVKLEYFQLSVDMPC